MIDTVFWRQVQARWTKESNVEFRSRDEIRKEAEELEDLVSSMMDMDLRGGLLWTRKRKTTMIPAIA